MTPQAHAGRQPRTAIGLDIGGTKIAAGVVTQDGKVLERTSIPTPGTADRSAILAVLCDLIGKLRLSHPHVIAVGVGAAGMVEWPSGHIRWASNNAYRELPLRDLLMQETGLHTVVENDANAAAAAESRFGAGAGYSHSVTLTIGTGIGCGIVVDGNLYRGPSGIAAEVGHIIVNPASGARCGCGAIGCLETMASGIALARIGRQAAATDPDGFLAGLAGGPDKVRGETVFQAAQSNDPTALGLFDQLGYWLGIGIASLVNILDPQVVILAGGIAESAGELLLNPARETFESHTFAGDRRTMPPIVPAMLGVDAGLIGAVALAFDQAADTTQAT